MRDAPNFDERPCVVDHISEKSPLMHTHKWFRKVTCSEKREPGFSLHTPPYIASQKTMAFTFKKRKSFERIPSLPRPSFRDMLPRDF
eukprot:953955-Amorphochlora_amoeboformis.AAC.1